MDGCDEKYKRKKIHPIHPIAMDRLHPKRDEKICQEILHNKNTTGMDGRTDMPTKKKKKHHPTGMDRYAKKY